MGLRISTNMAAIVAQRALRHTSEAQKASFQRIASGDAITTAGDDAAGLAISENMRAQIRSLGQADRNANDGISLIQVAEGGMTELSNLLIRMRELAINAASDTIGDRERGFVDKEFQQLVKEVDRIANVTNFNGTPLLNGEAKNSELDFQIGIHNKEQDRIVFKVNENNVKADEIGISGLSVKERDDARESLENIDKGLAKFAETRSTFGALQNKMRATSNAIQITRENLMQANSRIRDTDVAQEASELARTNILQHTGISVLAQANLTPQAALRLI